MVSNCRHQTLSRVLGIKSQDDVPTSTERESNDHTKKKKKRICDEPGRFSSLEELEKDLRGDLHWFPKGS